jgi:deoxyadenosine/deoxycytidine kinase
MTMYVAVEGIIGAGKSTLASFLAKKMDWRMLAEPIDGNPLLAKFYEDPKRWAFTMQIRMLHERYRLQQVAAHDHQPCILDRSLPGDRVFAKLQVAYGNNSGTPHPATVKLQDRMMKLHAAYAKIGPRDPDGMWLSWADAVDILAALGERASHE